MQITRAKATALLNKGEMTLYDESRHNAIRGFTAKQLETRIARARSARDRSRDLARRQKLSSRASTGSKRGTSGAANQRSLDKVDIMAAILSRFEARLEEARMLEQEQADAGAASARKAATGKTARRSGRREGREAVRKEVKTAATPARKAAKKAATATRATVKKAAKKAAAQPAEPAAKKAAKKSARKAAKTPGDATSAGRRAAGKAVTSAAGKVTPKQALRSTRKVLEAKQEQARQPRPWEEATAHGGQVGGEGFQSGQAARRAEELQAAESRMPAIHGSAGTRGRINQGKRDSKDRA